MKGQQGRTELRKETRENQGENHGKPTDHIGVPLFVAGAVFCPRPGAQTSCIERNMQKFANTKTK